MKRIISVLLAVIFMLSASTTCFAQNDTVSETLTPVTGQMTDIQRAWYFAKNSTSFLNIVKLIFTAVHTVTG